MKNNIRHQSTKNVLLEAAEMLSRPSKDVKRKILIFFNLSIGLSVVVYNIISLVQFGNFNNPARDWIIYPLVWLIMGSSAFYNIRNLWDDLPGDTRWNNAFIWATFLLLQIVSIIIVHNNTNIALSFLWDLSISLLLIFVTAVMIGRWVAVVYTVVALTNMLIAASRIGFNFVYVVDGFESKPISQFIVLWILIFGIALLVSFYESGVIGRVLQTIPHVVTRIKAVGEETRKLEMENNRMGAELDIAKRLQLMVLPTKQELSMNHDLEITAFMEPAKEVGGDYYDALIKDKATYIAIGDVTDHGLASGVVMMMVQSAFRILLEEDEPIIPKALIRLNALLYKNIQGRLQDFRNMTLVIIKYESGSLEICGQHEKVIICRENGNIEIIDTLDLGLYVGLVADIADQLHIHKTTLAKGDHILLYTDGVTEAENNLGEQFGEQRLIDLLKRSLQVSLGQMLEDIKEGVFSWINGANVYDDITLVLIKSREAA